MGLWGGWWGWVFLKNFLELSRTCGGVQNNIVTTKFWYTTFVKMVMTDLPVEYLIVSKKLHFHHYSLLVCKKNLKSENLTFSRPFSTLPSCKTDMIYISYLFLNVCKVYFCPVQAVSSHFGSVRNDSFPVMYNKMYTQTSNG